MTNADYYLQLLRGTAADDSTVPACCRDIGEQWPDTTTPWTDEEAPFPIPSVGTLIVVGFVVGLIASYFWPNPWWLP